MIPKDPLIKSLLAHGYVDLSQLNKALLIQEKQNGDLLEILVIMGFISKQQLHEVKQNFQKEVTHAAIPLIETEAPSFQMRPATEAPSFQMRPATESPSIQMRPDTEAPSFQMRPQAAPPHGSQGALPQRPPQVQRPSHPSMPAGAGVPPQHRVPPHQGQRPNYPPSHSQGNMPHGSQGGYLPQMPPQIHPSQGQPQQPMSYGSRGSHPALHPAPRPSSASGQYPSYPSHPAHPAQPSGQGAYLPPVPPQIHPSYASLPHMDSHPGHSQQSISMQGLSSPVYPAAHPPVKGRGLGGPTFKPSYATLPAHAEEPAILKRLSQNQKDHSRNVAMDTIADSVNDVLLGDICSSIDELWGKDQAEAMQAEGRLESFETAPPTEAQSPLEFLGLDAPLTAIPANTPMPGESGHPEQAASQSSVPAQSHPQPAQEAQDSQYSVPALKAVDSLKPIERVASRFALKGKLQECPYYTTYHAQDEDENKDVLLKLYPLFPELEEETVENFRKSASKVCGLEHPNLSNTFTSGIDGFHGYIVEEVFMAESFRDYLKRRGAFPLFELIPFFRIIGGALEAIHRRGLTHQNLQIENIFIPKSSQDSFEGVKLFNITVPPLLSPHLAFELLRSTPAPLPVAPCPEIRNPLQIDYLADIYGLGVLLFEVITGRPPFLGTSSMDLLLQHRFVSPPRITQVCPELSYPPALQELLSDSLQKSPQKRPSSIQEWLTRFEEVCALAPNLVTSASSMPSYTLPLDQQLQDVSHQLLSRCGHEEPFTESDREKMLAALSLTLRTLNPKSLSSRSKKGSSSPLMQSHHFVLSPGESK